MKKNISINISGIIFHIEEDGYEKLKAYLDSINKYFSTFEDSSEIIADIESRIAEIFLGKLKESETQVVTMEDVDALMATMGTVADFKAAEEETQPPVTEKEPVEEEKTEEKERPKRLFRDLNKKILGGVASGIAYYFKVDPLWIRLIFLLIFLNIFIGVGLSGVILLAYIIMWIVVPGSRELTDDKRVKKMFRNSDNKVLGGVASGLAAYFGADITLIRLLFIISIFLGGTGLVIYIILWIITPEAKSITEKMEMQGEEVTLSNIESTVKDRSSTKGDEEESAWVTIFLFPFRVIGRVFRALGELLGPASKFLLEALRVLVSLILIAIGLSLVVALILFTVISFGLVTGLEQWVSVGDLPLEVFQGALPGFAMLFLFLTFFIPSLALSLFGFALLFKTSITNRYVGLALFGAWLIGLIGSAIVLPKTISEFRRSGELTVTTDYDLQGRQAVMKLKDGEIMEYQGATLTLRGHQDSVFTLVQDFEARGSSLENARVNAAMIDYKVSLEDSVFSFDPNVTFKPEAKFRFQEVSMIMYVPYGQVFYMDESLESILRNTIYRNGYSVRDIPDNQWIFSDEGLLCITCPEDRRRSRSGRTMRRGTKGYEYENFDEFRDFDEISASGDFDFFVEQGDNYRVEVFAKNRELDRIRIQQNGSNLEFEITDQRWFGNGIGRTIKVEVTMPNLEQVDLSGSCDLEAEGFSGNDLDIDIAGASNADLEVDYDQVYAELSGSSDLKLSGKANELVTDLSGASSLEAFKFRVKRADVEASGASSANIYVTEKVKARARGASSIEYKGNPRVEADESGAGSVRKRR